LLNRGYAMKKVLVMLAAFVTVAAHAQTGARGTLEWKCEGTGRDTMQCVVKNTGKRPAGICVDVIKVCKQGNHYAQMCTGQLQPGETASKVVAGFDPKVKLLERCVGVEYGDSVID
jgi:hypothetical protein